jgi:hypothetical protein
VVVRRRRGRVERRSILRILESDIDFKVTGDRCPMISGLIFGTYLLI